uniref:Uncharacterized protein n=1 Tax=Terrapene triunguis TaxID=2587831 RepID=A0A674J4K5_9SAUR
IPLSVSGRGGAESQDRMRDSSAPSSASSSVTDLYCTPHSSRSDLFLPSTAGDFSLSASLSAWRANGLSVLELGILELP